MPTYPTVPVTADPIRLGQFLKLANLVDSGAEARAVIADEQVRVNLTPELRRGRQLAAGDIVEVHRPMGWAGAIVGCVSNATESVPE